MNSQAPTQAQTCSSVCPRCQGPVACGINNASCWCQSRATLKTNFAPEPAQSLACLCSNCLDALLLAQQQRASEHTT